MPPASFADDLESSLESVDGLSALLKYLAPETQALALDWCHETDTPSVQVLRELLEQQLLLLERLSVFVVRFPHELYKISLFRLR